MNELSEPRIHFNRKDVVPDDFVKRSGCHVGDEIVVGLDQCRHFQCLHPLHKVVVSLGNPGIFGKRKSSFAKIRQYLSEMLASLFLSSFLKKKCRSVHSFLTLLQEYVDRVRRRSNGWIRGYFRHFNR